MTPLVLTSSQTFALVVTTGLAMGQVALLIGAGLVAALRRR